MHPITSTTMIGTDIAKAKQLLAQDKIIALPTETVYGIAVNAFSPIALQQLFAAKKRPLTKPLALQTHSIKSVYDFVQHISPKALQLAKAFWPGPLTLILPKKKSIPDLLTAGKPTVGIRIPDHPLTLSLLLQLDFPLAVTSANISGQPSAFHPKQIQQQLGNHIAYILDGGIPKIGIASTILDCSNDNMTIQRIGTISETDIKALIQ